MSRRAAGVLALACVLGAGLTAASASATLGKVPGEGVTCPGNGIWGSEPPGLVPAFAFLGSTELEYGPCHTSAAKDGHSSFSKDGLRLSVDAMPGAVSSEAVGFWGATDAVSGIREICVSEQVSHKKGLVEQSWRLFIDGTLRTGQTGGLVDGALTECIATGTTDSVRWATFVSAEAGRHEGKEAAADVTLTSVVYR